MAHQLTKHGQARAALEALLSVREGMSASREAPIIRGLFYLGSLEAQLGQLDGARRDLALFLDRSRSSRDPETLGFRGEAEAKLRSLGG